MSRQSGAEIAFSRGIATQEGIFSRFTPPQGKKTENAAGSAELEPIDLKDYLSRTLPTAIEYVFTIILYGKNRNFFQWEVGEWSDFYKKIIDLYKDLIASVYGEVEIRRIQDYLESRSVACEVFAKNPIPGSNQTIFQVFQELMSLAMTDAIRHAVGNNLIDSGFFPFDYSRLKDFEYSDRHFEDGAEKKAEFLSGLEEMVDQALTYGFQSLGGEAGFVERVMTQVYYRYSKDEDVVGVGLAAQKKLEKQTENEMWAQLFVMVKRVENKIVALMQVDRLVTNEKIIGYLDEFAEGRSGCFEQFLRKNSWWFDALKDRDEEVHRDILERIKNLADVFTELDHWPLLTRLGVPKYRIKYKIVIWLQDVLWATNSFHSPTRISNFQTQVDLFLNNRAEMESVILNEKNY